MVRFRMDDDVIVDTRYSAQSWDDDVTWDGKNRISVQTGSQWDQQTLYRTQKGRYYIVCYSRRDGVLPRAQWLSMEEAARWLLRNGDELPDDLSHLKDVVGE